MSLAHGGGRARQGGVLRRPSTRARARAPPSARGAVPHELQSLHASSRAGRSSALAARRAGLTHGGYFLFKRHVVAVDRAPGCLRSPEWRRSRTTSCREYARRRRVHRRRGRGRARARRAARMITASPRSKSPSTRFTPAGSRLLPESSAFSAPASTWTVPRGSSCARDPALLRRHGIGRGEEPRAPSRRRRWPRSGCSTLPVVMTMLVPAPSAIFAGLDLGLHAALGQLRAGVAGHGLDLGGDLGDERECACAGRRSLGGAV